MSTEREVTSAEISLRYADTLAELDAVEPLWNALQDHHSRITPALGERTPKRDTAAAWRMRRGKYERWLEAPEAFFVIAEDTGKPVGYAASTSGTASSSASSSTTASATGKTELAQAEPSASSMKGPSNSPVAAAVTSGVSPGAVM
jgi:hypothetical protein